MQHNDEPPQDMVQRPVQSDLRAEVAEAISLERRLHNNTAVTEKQTDTQHGAKQSCTCFHCTREARPKNVKATCFIPEFLHSGDIKNLCNSHTENRPRAQPSRPTLRTEVVPSIEAAYIEDSCVQPQSGCLHRHGHTYTHPASCDTPQVEQHTSLHTSHPSYRSSPSVHTDHGCRLAMTRTACSPPQP